MRESDARGTPAATPLRRRGWLRAAPSATLALVLAAACRSAPPPPRVPDLPFAIPSTWTVPDTGAEDSGGEESSAELRWGAALALESVEELIAEALAGSPSLREMAHRVDAAHAEAVARGAARVPSLSLSAGARRSKIQFSGPAGDLIALRRTIFDAGFASSWELDLWGRVRAVHGRALAELQSEVAALRGARLSLAGQVAKAAVVRLDAGAQLRIARESLADAEAIRDRVADRARRGLRPVLDLHLAEGAVARARAEYSSRQRASDAATRRLEVLLGRYPRGALDLVEDLDEPLPPVPAGLPADLLTRRPDLVRAERQIAAAALGTRASRADLLPRISLTASAGTVSEHLADLLDGDFGVWSLAGNILAPLFEGGRRRAAVDAASAREEGATAHFVSLALDAFREVETALVADGLLAREAEERAAATRESRRALELSRERYGRGLVDILTLLEARRAHARDRSARSAIEALRRANRADLLVALGGGFEVDLHGGDVARAQQMASRAPRATPSGPERSPR